MHKTVEIRASCEPKMISERTENRDVAHEASESEPLLIKMSRRSRREVLFSAFVAEYLGVQGAQVQSPGIPIFVPFCLFSAICCFLVFVLCTVFIILL